MSQNKYLKIPIKGMHCRSCEILLEDSLKEVPQVKSVKANYKASEALVYYENQIPEQKALAKVIESAGYKIGQADKLPLLSTNKKEYRDLGFIFLFLTAVLLFFKTVNLFNFNLGSNFNSPSWGLIIVIGLVAGFSTCMALVGGLSLGLSTKFIKSHPQATALEKFRPHLFFITGRIVSYMVLGGLLGFLGSVFKFSALASGVLIILVGLVMLVMGLQLTNIFPCLNKLKLTLPTSVAKTFGFNSQPREYRHDKAAILGALTVFLPCGFTQAMQLYAISTGNFWSGVLVMGLFALGTAPGLLSIGGLTALIKDKFKARFFKGAGLAVILFALFNLSNGYNLVSLSFNSINKTDSKIINSSGVTLENGVQIVRMVEGNNGYTPNYFSIKKGVPVKWIITAKAPYSCASTILIPQLNINKNLEAGENIIEFTPSQTGKIPFSCSMGMYTGAFNVYKEEAPTASDLNVPVSATESAGNCGGSSDFCGVNKITPNIASAAAGESDNNVQLIKATYTVSGDIQPNSFTVKAGQPVRFEVYAKEDGAGCMGTIQIQNLYENIQRFVAGKTIVMEFTPEEAGNYLITCAMNIPHGTLKVQ